MRCVEFDLVYFAELFVLERAFFERIFKEFAGELDIFETVITHFFDLAFAPPNDRLPTLPASLLFVESTLGDRIKFVPATGDRLEFFHNVDASYLGQIAGIIFVEKRDIEVVGIVSDENVGSLDDRPQIRQFTLNIRRICVGLGIVDTDDRERKIGRVIRLYVSKEIGRFNVEGDDAHIIVPMFRTSVPQYDQREV